jgi:hypothetical protein
MNEIKGDIPKVSTTATEFLMHADFCSKRAREASLLSISRGRPSTWSTLDLGPRAVELTRFFGISPRKSDYALRIDQAGLTRRAPGDKCQNLG